MSKGLKVHSTAQTAQYIKLPLQQIEKAKLQSMLK